MEQSITRESLCEKTYCAVTHSDDAVQKYLAFPLRCKTWECPKCRKIKARDYRSRMSRMRELPALYMYSFTFDTKMTKEEAWATYNKAWNRLRTNLVKQCGKFNYVRVLEPQPGRNYPHIHVIADCYFAPTILGPATVSAGFGYQLEGHQIDSEDALDYVVKYLTKSWPTGESVRLRKENRCRIISFSRGFLSPKLRPEGWKLLIHGTDFESCLDHILVDYTWKTTEKAHVIYENEQDSSYEVHIVWEKIVPPGAFSAKEQIDDDRKNLRQDE